MTTTLLETTLSVDTSLSAEVFAPAIKTVGVHSLSRPSLSYWQDAWLRLGKNRQAITSLVIIALLAFFTLAGPLLWRVDPAAQDLSQISQGPGFGTSAVVVSDTEVFNPTFAKELPQGTVSSAMALDSPQGLTTVSAPSTVAVQLKWDPVSGATGYVIYRKDIKPKRASDIGLPLAEIKDPKQLSYQDQLTLEAKPYYYTLMATLNGEESGNMTQLEVTPTQALKLADALKVSSSAQVGQKIGLPAHPFGTDYLGRDLLARLMAGARVSLFIGFVAPMIYIALGLLIGGISGYYGGRVDLAIMRITDLVIALPFLLFMILFRIAFGVGPGESGVFPLLVALISLSWTSASRLTRGQVLQLRESEYVHAAKLLGAKPLYVLIRHLIPNTMGVILVSLTFAIPSTIFTEAFLSFIGMGVVPPTPSWGSLCNDGIQTFLSHPHEFLFPAFFISVTVLAFNLLGDGLRDALDPRLRSTE